jgi:phospholipid/cholesterol/gamma-HCH transport system substrate-binding protein
MSVLERAPAPGAPRAVPPPEHRPRWRRARARAAGLVFLAVLALLGYLAVAVYNKQFTQTAMVNLETGVTGNEMHPGAYVMVRGVQVGEVRSITANGQGATLQLAVQPAELSYIPANVTAEMLPTTLFGERYVDLIIPPQPSAARLAAGDVIGQDRSSDALEIQQVLDNLLPMLQSLQPAQLSISLTAIAQGLTGRGAELGRTLVQLNSYLKATNPNLPALDADIRELAGFARTYTAASPDLLAALRDFSVTSSTLADQQSNLSALYSTLTTASDDLHSFIAANESNMINLSVNSVGALRILGRYSPEFPCTLRQLVQFEPVVNKALGAGTNQPGLHARAIVVPVNASARYRPGVSTPRFGDNLGPRCYATPFRGISLNDGAGGTTSTRAAIRGPAAAPGIANVAATGQAGLASSPYETELVRELAALALRTSPSRIPGWSDLLLGPLYRGTTVKLTAARS